MDKIHFSKRAKARIILYLTTLFIVLGAFCVIQTVKANRFKHEAMLTKQMALTALDENLNNISTNLEKTIYVSTPTMMSKLSAELWREASGAKNCLSMLPTGDTAINNTYKFLSQIGEFVMSLERKSTRGEPLTDKEREQLKNLYSFCNNLNEQVNQMCHDMQNGNFAFEKNTSTLLNANNDLKSIGESFDDTEQTMTDLPTLIYDGPFSDHLTQTNPKFIENEKEITQDDALKIAISVCPAEKDNFSLSHEEDGNIPCYVFKGKNCSVAITKKGGKPCYMLSSEFSGEVKIKHEEAIRIAKRFLNQIGYSDMKESYYFTEDGICTINFAATKNDTVLYPDLIKVSVCLEKGKVVSFDATGYISNHTERKDINPSISEMNAIDKINHTLKVIDTQKCVIPTEWETEQICYEIHCKTEDNRELLVYIDGNTGEEDNILILLYSDNGVLTK